MDIQLQINEVLTEWGEMVKDKLRQKASRFSKSGNLVNSINYQVIQSSASPLAAILLGFDDYGRFIDMKRDPSFNQGIQQLQAFILKEGRSKFKPPTYSSGKEIQYNTNEAFANALAWKMLQARYNKRGNYKPKVRKWFNNNFWKLLPDLRNAILDNASEEALKQFEELRNKQIKLM